MMRKSMASLVFSFLIIIIKVLCCQQMHILNITAATGHRIRHTRERNVQLDATSELDGRSEAIHDIEEQVLQGTGLDRLPLPTDFEIPDYMRDILRRQLESEEIEEEKAHFWADKANLILTASQVHVEDYGETMQFTLGPNEQEDRIIESKLYFNINPLKIRMSKDNFTEPMHLALNMMVVKQDGILEKHLVNDKILIHPHLVGWHNYNIPPEMIKKLHLASQERRANITFNFHLSCLNCQYQVFPDTITTQTVPFLAMNGRRRSRRNPNRVCNSNCCLKELIVDFNALGSKWNFVIHPRRYQANYCSGSCMQPSPIDRAQMTSNTHIINEMLSRQRAAATSSCCVAAEEDRVMLAYYIDGGTVRTTNSAIKKIKSCRCT